MAPTVIGLLLSSIAWLAVIIGAIRCRPSRFGLALAAPLLLVATLNSSQPFDALMDPDYLGYRFGLLRAPAGAEAAFLASIVFLSAVISAFIAATRPAGGSLWVVSITCGGFTVAMGLPWIITAFSNPGENALQFGDYGTLPVWLSTIIILSLLALPFALGSVWAGRAAARGVREAARAHERAILVAELSAQEARLAAKEAQLATLRYQINPHFLFNALSAASTLIQDKQNDVADEMLLHLARFYRASLTGDLASEIQLVEEVAIQEAYLEIEKIRFEDTLEFEFEIDEAVRHALVPSLILQPLVENSVKHGMGRHGKLMTISVKAHRYGDRLHIRVADNGLGAGKKVGTMTGLKNIEQRLALHYDENYKFSSSPLNPGFAVDLQLPLKIANSRAVQAG